jgi:diguanylate cyclase (GGDEF)-like protein
MALSVRLLLVGDSKELRILAEDLLKAGNPAYRVETAAQAYKIAHAEMPDIVIVEDESLRQPGIFVAGMAEACRPMVPVMVAACGPSIDRQRRVELEATVDEVMTGPLDAATVLFRLEPLARLATMRNELKLRHLTLDGVGMRAEIPPVEPADFPVLVLADNPKQAASLGHAAERIGARVIFSDDPFNAERILAGEECGALVAVVDSSIGYGVLDLCRQVRKNARLFHLPILLLADALAPLMGPVEAYAQGASLVLPQNVDNDALAAEIAAQLQRQRHRRKLRDQLIGIIPAALLDSQTGLLTESFMQKHLETMAEAHAVRRRPLSLVVFAIRNIQAAIARYGEAKAARLHGEVARWITRLVRAEDGVFRLPNGEFAVALPNTEESEARSLMHRIDDVLSNTEFGIDGEPFSLWIAAGIATARENDKAAAFMAQARLTVRELQL